MGRSTNMSDQLKNILLWGAFGLVAVLGFVVIYDAVADEAADAERDTRAPYLTRVLHHVIRHKAIATGDMMSNPASVNCATQGGRLSIQSAPSGQWGLCTFTDSMQCEEWALLRGECPKGGVKVSGLTTEAARVCEIRGGTYKMTFTARGSYSEKGTCTLFDKKTVCGADEFYNMTCPKATQ